jgi:hypothetical protein
MENHSFVDDFPIKTSMYHQFSHIFLWMFLYGPRIFPYFRILDGGILPEPRPNVGPESTWPGQMGPFALYLKQLGTRISHFVRYLLHFGTSTVHVAFLRVSLGLHLI